MSFTSKKQIELFSNQKATETPQQWLPTLSGLFCWKVAAMYQSKNFVMKFNLPEGFSEYICTSHEVWLTARQNSFSSCLQKDHYTSSVYHVIYRLRKKCCVNVTWHSQGGRFHSFSTSIYTSQVINCKLDIIFCSECF